MRLTSPTVQVGGCSFLSDPATTHRLPLKSPNRQVGDCSFQPTQRRRRSPPESPNREVGDCSFLPNTGTTLRLPLKSPNRQVGDCSFQPTKTPPLTSQIPQPGGWGLFISTY